MLKRNLTCKQTICIAIFIVYIGRTTCERFRAHTNETNICMSGRPSRSDTDQAVQSQEQARSFKFRNKSNRNCTTRVAKPKALISCADTAQLIFAFGFA